MHRFAFFFTVFIIIPLYVQSADATGEFTLNYGDRYFELDSWLGVTRECNPKVLAMKFDGTQACVYPSTFVELYQRGWMHPEWRSTENAVPKINEAILDKLQTGEITLLTREFLVNEAKTDKIVFDLLDKADYKIQCCMFQIDRGEYPLNRYVGIVFDITEQNTSITVTYDLTQETVTNVNTSAMGTENRFDSISDNTPDVSSGITVLEPNSMEFFYYPNPSDTENRDAFDLFLLIRLPEWLGGDAENASAYRAYSAVSLSVDHCLVKYHGDTRQRIEQPCVGGIYRAVDGLLIQNVDPILITRPLALPHLDLSTDETGTLYVDSPVWSIQENGVISYGKEMTMSDIRAGSKFIIDSFENAFPEYPDIPITFAGYTLADVMPDRNSVQVQYFDFSSLSGYYFMTIEKSSKLEEEYFLNLAQPNTEYWQIGDNVIKIGGTAMDESNTRPDRYKSYVAEFYEDGFHFRIEGKNIGFMKQQIASNYFSEHDYDEMFLVSKN